MFRFRHSYYGPGKHVLLLIGLKGLVDAGSVEEQNTALSFELIKLINHPLKNLKFQGLFLRWVVCSLSNGGATLLVVS